MAELQHHLEGSSRFHQVLNASFPPGISERTASSVVDSAADLHNLAEASAGAAQVIEAYASRLSQFYGETGGDANEHPSYSYHEWSVESGRVTRGEVDYWSWVVVNIKQDRAMWPWDRETSPSVLIARAAKITVSRLDCWVTSGEEANEVSHLRFGSELEAWQAGAHSILAKLESREGRSIFDLEAMPLTLLTHWVSLCLSGAMTEEQSFLEPGAMPEAERVGNHWAQVAQAAGIAVQRSTTGWMLINGPDVPLVSRTTEYSNEASAWRAAAAGLLEHLRQHLESPFEQWQTKSPGQHLDLAKTFYADYRAPAPDFGFTEHYHHAAKVLCQNVGWRVTKVRGTPDSEIPGWQLNRKGHYFAEANAWLAGADRIRQLVMQRANISYLQWLSLPLEEQISIGLTHALY